MADSSAHGRFIWHELMTPNSAGAQEFYSKTLGWKVEPWDQQPNYSMFAAPTGPLGASVESREGAPYWVPFVGVTDVDATARQAAELGGSVKTEPTATPNGGRYAVLADPQGGTFGIYSSPADLGPETEPAVGEFSWHELATTDNQAAFDFYSPLFAWENVSEFDMGPMGIYLIFGRNGKQMGGMFNKGDTGKPGPAYWVNYVRVEDVQETVKKVEAERGSLLTGPMEVPGGDWIAQFTDPHGALFAVHALASDVKAAERPELPAAAASERPAGQPAKQSSRTAAKRSAKKKATKKKTTQKTGKKKAAKAKTAKTKAANKKAANKKAAKKKVSKKKAAKKKSTSKKAANKKSPSQKAGSKKAGGRKAGNKKTGKKTATKRKPANKKAASNKAASNKAASNKAASKKRATAGKKPSKAGKRKPARRR